MATLSNIYVGFCGHQIQLKIRIPLVGKGMKDNVLESPKFSGGIFIGSC